MSLKRLVYLTSARLPTEKAHGLQIMKMCEAFADNGLDVTLLYPHRRQPPGMASSDGPFSFYGVRPVFEAKRLPCFDVGFLKRISESLWFWTLDFTATASILLESRRFSAAGDVIFYSRDPLMTLAGLALCRKHTETVGVRGAPSPFFISSGAPAGERGRSRRPDRGTQESFRRRRR